MTRPGERAELVALCAIAALLCLIAAVGWVKFGQWVWGMVG